jgi:hypothetical protein
MMSCIFQVKENANLQASLERRKESLHERRIALEKEVRAQTQGFYFLSTMRTPWSIVAARSFAFS